MLRTLASFSLLALLAGCISLSSTETPSAPNYAAFCQEKEAQCKQTCGDAGVQSFSCRASPPDVLEYQCDCKKPLVKSI